MNVADALQLARAHFAAGRHPEAEAIFRQVLAADPRCADAWHGLGVLACAHGHGEPGIAMIRQAIAFSPQPLYYSNLGEIFRRAGMIGEAIEACRAALALRTGMPFALYHLALAQRDAGLVDEALANVREAAQAIDDDGGAAHSALLVTMHYVDGIPRDELFREHRAWAQRHAAAPAAGSPVHPNTRDPDRPLRIGYVSGDFRQHSVAYFIRSILARHDRGACDVYCYSNSDLADSVTEDFRRLVPNWRDVAALSDAQLIEQIRSDGVDILVDLSGHTAGARLRAFAAQPAPVQVTYLGYPDTTGLATMQWRITDAIADPPGKSEQYHTERLMRLPRGSFLCFAPPADAPPVGPGFREAHRPLTFVSFNAPAKITPAMIRLWAEILRGVPGSRLMFKAFAFQSAEPRERILRAFESHGVDADRIELLPRAATTADHLAAYQRADVALDTFPYNGVTTTCEALWMGVPVVTLAGQTHVSRVGASILRAVGLDEFVATDAENYVRIASELAADPNRLAELRAGLRQRMADSPLMDVARFVSWLEQAYRAMWRQWCAG